VPEVITPDVNTLIRISAIRRIIILLKKFFILGGETFWGSWTFSLRLHRLESGATQFYSFARNPVLLSPARQGMTRRQ
jgi:hypothetical protein